MGNQQPQTSEIPNEKPPPPRQYPPEERAQHKRVGIENGEVVCTCSGTFRNEHEYNMHVEMDVPMFQGFLKPLEASGWPLVHFDTVPYVKHTQRGVVSRGSIPYASFTFLTLHKKFDEPTVRHAIASVPEIASSMNALSSCGDLFVTALVSISPNLWKRWDPFPPPELEEFQDKKNAGDDSEVLFPKRPGKYQIFLLAKGSRVDLCYEVTQRFLQLLDSNTNCTSVETTQGFAYLPQHPYGGRDLTGFLDGTRNPDHLLRSLTDEIVIFPDDFPHAPPHVGGSYMFAGRFVHDLPKFFSLPPSDKNAIIGRDHAVIRPHVGFDDRPENPRLGDAGKDEFATMNGAPPRSHVVRAYGSMYRQAYPFVTKDEKGLFFTAYSRFLTEIDTAIERMCGRYVEDKSTDNLLSITRAMECMYYYVPSLRELARLDPACSVDNFPSKSSTKKSEKAKEVPVVDVQSQGEPIILNVDKPLKIFFEYCTNCGYKTIFMEKKRVMQSVSESIQIIGNPNIPRLAAFEIYLEDGTIIWSKLGHPHGKNNDHYVFPTNAHLVEKLKKIFVEKNLVFPEDINTEKQGCIYVDASTDVGVW